MYNLQRHLPNSTEIYCSYIACQLNIWRHWSGIKLKLSNCTQARREIWHLHWKQQLQAISLSQTILLLPGQPHICWTIKSAVEVSARGVTTYGTCRMSCPCTPEYITFAKAAMIDVILWLGPHICIRWELQSQERRLTWCWGANPYGEIIYDSYLMFRDLRPCISIETSPWQKLKGDNTTRRHRNPCCWLYYRLYRTFHRLSGCIITDVSLYPHQLITSVQSSPRFLMLQDLTTIGTQFCGRRPFRQSWWSTLLDNITLSYPSAFPAVVVPFLKPINGPTTLMDGQHPLSLDTDSDPFMFPINRWWHIPSRNGARVSTSPHRRTNTRNIAVANIQSNVLGDILPAIREQAQYEPIAEEHVRCLESPNQTWSTSYMLPRWRDALEKERELPHTEWWLLYDLYRASSILQIVGENCILPLFVSSSLSCRFAWKPARSRMRWCLDMAPFDGILGFQPNEWSIVLSLCNIESNPQYRWNDIHLILYLVNRPEDHRRQTSSFGIGLLPITKIICMVILVSTAIDPYMRP